LSSSVLAQNNWHFVDESSSRIPDIQCVGRWVDAANVNNDSSLDVLVGCGPGVWPQGPGYEQLYYNNGSGFFMLADSTQFPQLNDETGCAILFDCDGDDYVDAYVVNFNYQTDYIALNDGNGAFTIDWSSLPADSAVGIIANYADIDGDGDIDICMLGNALIGDNAHRIWINDGNGHFENQSSRLPQLSLIYSTVEFADIDSDLDLDLLVNDRYDPGQARILINDGAGIFIDETSSRLPFANWSRVSEFVDLDNDNDFDIVLGYEERCGFFINDGLGFYTDETTLRGPVYPGFDSPPFEIKASDLDNDGDEDLLIGTGTAYIDLAFINVGNGFFEDQTVQRLPQQALSTKSMILADLDNDGDVDLFRTGSGYDRNSIYINTLNISDTIAPYIKNKTVLPPLVSDPGPYIVRVSATDGVSLGHQLSASLFYSTDGLDYFEVALRYVGGYMYYGEIPAVDSGITVNYYYNVEDKEGNTTLFPNCAPDSILSFTYSPLNTPVNDPGYSLFPESFKVSAYPNPFNSTTTIAINNVEGGELAADIYDVNGRLIYDLNINRVNENEQKVIWDGISTTGEKVSSGIYFVLVRNSNVQKCLKLTHIK
jgi:hypothetical protein